MPRDLRVVVVQWKFGNAADSTEVRPIPEMPLPWQQIFLTRLNPALVDNEIRRPT